MTLASITRGQAHVAADMAASDWMVGRRVRVKLTHKRATVVAISGSLVGLRYDGLPAGSDVITWHAPCCIRGIRGARRGMVSA